MIEYSNTSDDYICSLYNAHRSPEYTEHVFKFEPQGLEDAENNRLFFSRRNKTDDGHYTISGELILNDEYPVLKMSHIIKYNLPQSNGFTIFKDIYQLNGTEEEDTLVFNAEPTVLITIKKLQQ